MRWRSAFALLILLLGAAAFAGSVLATPRARAATKLSVASFSVTPVLDWSNEARPAIGEQVAAAVVALRANDGREKNPTVADLDPPAPGPGVWQPDPSRPVLGLRLPGIRPLALESASQFRPGGPNPMTSEEYAEDFG